MAHTQQQNKKFITFLLIFTLLLFLYLIRNYLVTMALAIVFTAVLFPAYNRLQIRLKGKKSLASILMTIGFLLIILIPSFYLLGQIISQATDITTQIVPVVEKQIELIQSSNQLPDWIPFSNDLAPFADQIKTGLGNLLSKVGGTVINGIGSITTGTMNFIISLFIMLYAIYFFLLQGPRMITRLGYFLPLSENEFELIKNQLYNTSLATIKGALVIGLIQGTLVGISFAIVGIPGALFWGAVASIASLIPSVGCALVYVPAAIYLFLNGQEGSGIFVLLWGLIIVGTVDNFLRPVLIGKDTKISELTILLSTLGGITLFGLSGVILGPMIASLFITMSNIYLEENN